VGAVDPREIVDIPAEKAEPIHLEAQLLPNVFGIVDPVAALPEIG
jgi:hypothetical protein